MKRIIVSSLLALGLLSTTVYADVAKGQKLYSKKLKKPCGITGAKMASQHTQDEWETIMEEGNLSSEIKKICPNVVKEVNEKFIPHYYDFFYEYASDSGNVPSC